MIKIFHCLKCDKPFLEKELIINFYGYYQCPECRGANFSIEVPFRRNKKWIENLTS